MRYGKDLNTFVETSNISTSEVPLLESVTSIQAPLAPYDSATLFFTYTIKSPGAGVDIADTSVMEL